MRFLLFSIFLFFIAGKANGQMEKYADSVKSIVMKSSKRSKGKLLRDNTDSTHCGYLINKTAKAPTFAYIRQYKDEVDSETHYGYLDGRLVYVRVTYFPAGGGRGSSGEYFYKNNVVVFQKGNEVAKGDVDRFLKESNELYIRGRDLYSQK